MNKFFSMLAVISVVTTASVAPALSQTASSGPTVVDKNGKVIGTLIGRDEVLIKFADGDAVLKIDSFGLSTPAGVSPIYFYPTADCSGTRYVRADSFPALAYFDAYPTTPEPGRSLGGTIYYAKRPFIKMSIKSTGVPGFCIANAEQNVIMGTVGKSAYFPGVTLPISIR